MHLTQLPQKPQDHEEKKTDRIIKDITFFGDSSIPESSKLYKDVFETAKLLAENGFSVVNGGGPGVMKAATDGAEQGGGETVAVYWEPKLASIFEGKNLTNATDESATYSNYMMRTMGLIEKGHVFIVCQGGTGTISEWGMVWALAKLYFGKHKPVILFGEFWPDIIKAMQKGFLLDDNELGVLHYATTKEQVLEFVQMFEMEVETRSHRNYEGDETPFVLAPRYKEQLDKHLEQGDALHLKRVPNENTYRQLEEFRKLVGSPARVLDIGAGAGYDLSFLGQFAAVTAVEINPDMARIARFENPNVDIIEMDIMDYEIQENVFKGIWSRDALHNLKPEQLEKLFPKLHAGLVPGGVLFMIVREGEGEKEEKKILGGKHISRYYNFFSTEDIDNIVDTYGFELVSLEQVERSHKWLAVALRKPAE